MTKFIQFTEIKNDASLTVRIELQHIVSFGAVADSPYTLIRLEGGHTTNVRESIEQVMELINRYGK